MSVVYILLSADIPVLPYYILLLSSDALFELLVTSKKYFSNIYFMHLSHQSWNCLQINLNWVWPRRQFSHWVCSLSSLINLTTYEPNSESNFVAVAKFQKLLYIRLISCFILMMSTSDLIQTFQNRTYVIMCLPGNHDVQGFCLWSFCECIV